MNGYARERARWRLVDNTGKPHFMLTKCQARRMVWSFYAPERMSNRDRVHCATLCVARDRKEKRL